MRQIISLLTFMMAVNCQLSTLSAQTTVPAGPVSGTWKKSGSPYKINGQVTVPRDSTLKIEAGVKVEFQGSYMMHVYGSIQAKGVAGDSVWFTAANKTTGWQGIHIHRNKPGADSNLYFWSVFEYVVNIATSTSTGVFRLDTINNISFNNSVWRYNKAVRGACFVPIKCDVRFANCLFYRNEITSSNSAVVNSGGSVMNGGYNNIVFNNCKFLYNKSRLPLQADDSVKSRSGGVILFGLGDLQILGCEFIGNSASSYSCLYITSNSTDKIIISDTKFENNYSSGKACCYFGNSSAAQLSVKNTIFRKNRIGNYLISVQSTDLSVGFLTSSPSIDNCVFMSSNGYSAFDGHSVRVNHSQFIGIDSTAMYFPQGTDIRISNSLIANNYRGLFVGGYAVITNCAVVNNGNFKLSQYASPAGIQFGSSGSAASVSIYNSIVQNNYGPYGMANIIGGQGGTICQGIKNTILQGGTDSTKLLYISGKMQFNNLSNIFNDTVKFVNPPGGFGPEHYNPNNDFHILNTCSYTYPGWNAGLNSFTDVYSGIVVNHTNTVDLDGNPRIRCGTVDIGPYELEGSKQSVSISREPSDQLVCPKSTVTADAEACGAGVAYQWQSSSDGNNFANISGATAAGYNFIPADSGYYRLLIHQQECNKRDTSNVAKIAFKPGSTIKWISGMNDTAVCKNQAVSLKSTIGGSNLIWQWQQSNNGTSFSNITGGTTNPYLINAGSTSWYRLLVKNTLCNYSDTFSASKITANPLPTPNLGADATVPNNGSKLLNPGTFNNYLWSTGANTATLTVDKNNLNVGANSIWVEVTDANTCKGRDTVVITLEPSGGLQDPATAGILVFPIPAGKTLNIQLPEQFSATQESNKYQLNDLNGRLLLSGSLQLQTQVSLIDIPAGIYILTLEVDGKLYGLRVVK